MKEQQQDEMNKKDHGHNTAPLLCLADFGTFHLRDITNISHSYPVISITR